MIATQRVPSHEPNHHVHQALFQALRSLENYLWTLLKGEVTYNAVVEKIFDLAIQYDAGDAVNFLLLMGVDPNPPLSEERLPICTAIKWTSLRSLHLLLENGAVLKPQHLITAINKGNFDTVWFFLNRHAFGALFEDVPEAVLTSILASSMHPDLAAFLFRELLGRGGMITAASLVTAARYGHMACLNALFERGPDVNGTTAEGVSGLSAAAFSRDQATCSYFLRKGANINIRPENPAFGTSLSALGALFMSLVDGHKADSKAFRETLRLLLGKGADVNYCVRLDSGQLGRAYMALSMRPAGNHFHDHANGTTDTTFPFYLPVAEVQTPLEIALAFNADKTTVKNLLRYRERLVGMELILASKHKDVDVLALLVEAGADVNHIASTGTTALRVALQKKNALVAHYFLSCGTDLRSGDTFLAFTVPDITLHKEVIRLHGDITERGPRGESILETLFQNPPGPIVGDLFTKRCDEEELCAAVLQAVATESSWALPPTLSLESIWSSRPQHNSSLQGSVLGIVALYGRLDLIIQISQGSCYKDLCSKDLCSFNFECLERVVHDPSSLDLNRQSLISWRGDALLHRSVLCAAVMARQNPVAIIDYLLGVGFIPDSTSLLLALRVHPKNSALLRRLAEASVESPQGLSSCRSAFEPSPLQAAVFQEDLEAIDILSEARFDGPPPYRPCRSASGLPAILPRTALQHAAEKRNKILITTLLRDPDSVNEPTAYYSGATALQIAAAHGCLGLALRLLMHKADVNARGASVNGRTALEAAAETGRIDMLYWLLEYGVLTTDRYRAYIRAVLLAEQNGQYAAAQYLRGHRLWEDEDFEMDTHLSFEPDLNIIDPFGYKALLL